MLATAATAHAQTVYFSASDPDSFEGQGVESSAYVATGFVTDASALPYTLNSVTLTMGLSSGTPSNFQVALYSNSSGTPGVSLATATGNSNPFVNSGKSDFTYTFSGVTLAASTNYWIVASATGSEFNSYDWAGAMASGGDTSFTGPWTNAGGYDSNTGTPGSWTSLSGPGLSAMEISVTATPTAVPEPATYAWLAGLTGLALVVARRRRVVV